jgi:hypothetical protein
MRRTRGQRNVDDKNGKALLMAARKVAEISVPAWDRVSATRQKKPRVEGGSDWEHLWTVPSKNGEVSAYHPTTPKDSTEWQEEWPATAASMRKFGITGPMVDRIMTADAKVQTGGGGKEIDQAVVALATAIVCAHLHEVAYVSNFLLL